METWFYGSQGFVHVHGGSRRHRDSALSRGVQDSNSPLATDLLLLLRCDQPAISEGFDPIPILYPIACVVALQLTTVLPVGSRSMMPLQQDGRAEEERETESSSVFTKDGKPNGRTSRSCAVVMDGSLPVNCRLFTSAVYLLGTAQPA